MRLQPCGRRLHWPAERRGHLVAEAENVIGVAKRRPSGFGQNVCAPFPTEKRLAEGRFQRADLGGDGRGRNPEALRGGAQSPEPGYRPEVAKVVEIQRIHRGNN